MNPDSESPTGSEPAPLAEPGSAGPWVPPVMPPPAEQPPGYPPPGYPPHGYPPPGYAFAGYPPPGFMAGPPKRRGPVLAVVIGALVLLCALPVGVLAFGGNGHSSDRASAVFHSGSPSPTPLSPEAYQSLLTTLDSDLTARVQNLANAKTVNDVQSAAREAQGAVSSEVATVRAVKIPDAVRQANDTFLTRLDALGDSFQQLGSAGDPCYGAVAMVDLTNGSAADGVRTASKALATADPAHPYQVGSFLPAPAPKYPTGKPANGNVLKRTGPGGRGTMTVKNQGDNDVAVSLVPQNTNSAVGVFYVSAHKDATLNNVHDGTYQVYVTEGTEWDAGGKRFARDCVFTKLDDTEQYTTTNSQYTTWTLTLHVAGGGGNASGSAVDPGTFPN